MSGRNKTYEAYRHEFRMLRESGLRLYCPENVEVSPAELAKTISRDKNATYMRDMIYDGEGRPLRVNFLRIAIGEEKRQDPFS